MTGSRTQAELAEQALRQKMAAQAPVYPHNARTPRQGPSETPRPDTPPSGALDAEGQRPVLERARKVR